MFSNADFERIFQTHLHTLDRVHAQVDKISSLQQLVHTSYMNDLDCLSKPKK